MEPKTKSAKRLRGSARMTEDGRFDFTPDGTGTPRQEDVKKVGASARYRTCGEKKQSFVLHLTTPADSPDVVANLAQSFADLTRDLPQYKKMPQPKGRILASEDDMKVSYNSTQGQIECAFTISLKEHVEFMKQFYNLLNRIARCLYINEDFLKQQCRAIAKAGTK